MGKNRIFVNGKRIKELRETRTSTLTLDELGQWIGLKGKSAMSKIENNSNATVTEAQLKQLCEILDCDEGYLRGLHDDPYMSVIIDDNGQKIELRKPFIADDIYSHYVRPIYALSAKKKCSLDKILDYLSMCNDNDLERFDNIVAAYFYDLPPFHAESTSEQVESYVKTKIIPELTLSIIKTLREDFSDTLNNYDWEDKVFHNSLAQNLGDFKKEANLRFKGKLKRTTAESTTKSENLSIRNITEDAIEYLTYCIAYLLKKKGNESDFYQKDISITKYNEMKMEFPKYITRNLETQITPWENLIREFLEKYEEK